MAKEIGDPKEYLRQAKTAVIELEGWKDTFETAGAEEKKLEKELSGERKAVADEIASTIKKRREELEKTYDDQIKILQDKLKAERNKRAKKREKGVKARMEEETEYLRSQNQEIRKNTREVLAADKVPAFCNNTWYYAMFFTSGLKELLILALTVAVWVLGIPALIYLALPNKVWWKFALIAVIFLIIFILVYIVIGNMTKARHYAALREGRRLRNQVRSNNAQIARIKNGIRKDKNDDVYDLGEFDQAINGFEEEIAVLQKKKEEAIALFEQETDPMIRREIQDNSRERLTQLEQGLEEQRARRTEAEGEIQRRTIALSEDYESVVGKEMMSPEKLDDLLTVLDSESPANVTEAVQIYRARGMK